MQDHEDVSEYLKEAVKKEYEIHIMNRVMTEKKAIIAKWKARKDYQAMLQVVSNDADVALGMFKHPAQEMKQYQEAQDMFEPDIPDMM